jgi:hypothetical protein
MSPITVQWRKAMKAMKLAAPLAIAAGLLSSSCVPAFVQNSDADVILRIVSLAGQPGSEDLDAGPVLFSDTCCAIINDNIEINVDSVLKNANSPTVNAFSDITLERYEVRYLRSDGRNVEGVDVPFHITGPLASTLVGVGSTASVSVVGVRHQAKLEPPLKNLEGKFSNDSGTAITGLIFSGAGIVSTIAEVTIHGRTTSGQAVQAVGRIQIVFADFSGEG